MFTPTLRLAFHAIYADRSRYYTDGALGPDVLAGGTDDSGFGRGRRIGYCTWRPWPGVQ
jgi:hypothetical protein